VHRLCGGVFIRLGFGAKVERACGCCYLQCAWDWDIVERNFTCGLGGITLLVVVLLSSWRYLVALLVVVVVRGG
jgi:hypothetical protein